MPIDERAELFVAFQIDECVGQESNLQCHQAGGLQSLGHANAQPTHICSVKERFISGTSGSRTHRPRRFELRRFADLRTVPLLDLSKRSRWDLNPRSPP